VSNLRELLFQRDAENRTATVDGGGKKTVAAGTIPKHVLDQSANKRRLSLTGSVFQGSNAPAAVEAENRLREYQRLKSKIHTKLIESIDIQALVVRDQSEPLEAAIESAVHILIDEEKLPLTAEERVRVARDVLYETLGLGPLEPLLGDPDINDILVNGHDSVWVDRNGRLEPTEIRFKDDSHLMHVIGRIVARVGRRVDESSPIVDARLPDGSRVNAIIPPLALDGPTLSIRRFRAIPFAPDDMIVKGTLNEQMAEFLGLAVQARLNILISGGTSAGKTTLLNMLSGFISERERIVTIEDTAELRLQQRHIVRLESRPSNIEGQGSVTQRELVKNALRMRPDRIIVGEVRGAEALDMLQAMNTGHEGSLTTVHANTPRDALLRLETMVLMSGVELPLRAIREQIASSIDLIVQLGRRTDGARVVTHITEVQGREGDTITLQDVFDRSHTGPIRSTGLRPRAADKLAERSVEIPLTIFRRTAVAAAAPTRRAAR
jgi:pilus assembly protein CpaF